MRRTGNWQARVDRTFAPIRAIRGAASGMGIALLVALASGPAKGQSASHLDQAIAAQNTILQRFTPPPRVGSVEISVQDQRRRGTDEEAARLRFRLRSLIVEGAYSLPAGTLVPIWRDRIGEEISVADLYRIAEAVDAAYVGAGYFSMTIVPVQAFATGNITLRVYESYVATVKITSSLPGIEHRLKPYIDRIVAMHPIRIKEAERILSLLSDLGGLEIEGTFIRPEVPTGGGALELDVGFARARGMIGLDNLGSDAVGPLELSGNVVLNDLLGLFDTTSLVAVTVPDTLRELAFLQATQEIPIGYDGLTLGYSLTYVSAKPGGPLKTLNIESEMRLGTAYLSYPFIRSLDQNLFGQIEINAQNDNLDIGGGTVDRGRARWLLVSMRYDRDLNLGSIAGSFGLGQGFDHKIARTEVPEDYRFVSADLDYNQPLGKTFSARLRASGQYAATPIPGAVQFALGGDPYGLAFDGGAVSGDSGAATAFELSHGVETGIAALGGVSITALADYGVVWNNGDVSDAARDTLGSIGIGVSGVLSERVSFQLLAAQAWDTGDTGEDPGTRLFFRMGMPL